MLVEPAQRYIIHFKIVHQTVQSLPSSGTSDEMHPCLELHSVSPETLKTTADLCSLFENRYLIAVPSEDNATRKTA